jgi:hypothetical protein
MRRVIFIFVVMLVFIGSLSAQSISPTNYWAYTDTVSVTFTRPANATAYAANDRVCGADTSFFVFTLSNRTTQRGFIVGAFLYADTANTANALFRLRLFSDTSTSNGGVAISRIADNAPWTYLKGYQYKDMGYIDFALQTAGTGSTAAYDFTTGLNIPYTLKTQSKFFGVLVATAAYQPANAGRFYIKLWLLKD